MELGGLEIILTLLIPWALLLLISSRIDLEKYGILVAPGIIIYKSRFMKSILEKSKRWKNFVRQITEKNYFFILTIFISLPLLLFINLIVGFTNQPVPFILPNPISHLSIEDVALIIIPVIVSLLVHDIVQGISATAEEVEIEQTGLAVIILLITSFLQFSTAIGRIQPRKRMKIISMGISANILLILICLPLYLGSSAVMSPMYEQANGALIVNVLEETPASIARIARGDVITGFREVIFGQALSVVNVTSANELLAKLRDIPAGTPFILVFLDNEVKLSGIIPPLNSKQSSGSYLGIELTDYRPGRLKIFSPFLPYWFKLEMQWMVNINIVLGLLNILPIPLSDGGLISEFLIQYNIKVEYQERVKKILWTSMSIILLLNIFQIIF